MSLYEKRLQNRDSIVLLLVFLLNFTFFYYGNVNTQYAYNSDNAFYAIAGKDIISGNILLKGWVGGNVTFYFLDVIYGILGCFFGYGISLIYIVSSVIWASFVTMISYYSLILNSSFGVVKYLKLGMVVALCMSSCYFKQPDKIMAGAHIDACILGLVYVWLIMEEDIEFNTVGKWLRLIIAVFCLILSIVSDGLVIYMWVAPVIIVTIGNLFFSERSKEEKKHLFFRLLLTIFVVIASKIIMKIIGTVGGIYTDYSEGAIKLVESGELFDRIEYFIEELIYLFDADLFGLYINGSNFAYFFRFMFIAILLFSLVLCINQLGKRLFNQVMLVTIIVEVAVIIFSSSITVETIPFTSRLLYYFFIALVILCSQIDISRMVERFKIGINSNMISFLSSVGVILLLVISLLGIERTDYSQSENRYQKTAEVLKEKQLTHGYGTYWLANVVTLASDCEIYVNSVAFPDLTKHEWLSFSTEKWDYANFVLVDDSNWAQVTEDSVIECIGPPNEELQIENIKVLIWDKNIMPYINGSGADVNLDYWWSIEPGDTQKSIDISNKHWFSDFNADEKGMFTSTGEGVLIYGPYQHLDEGIYNIKFLYEYGGVSEDCIGYVDVISGTDKLSYSRMDIYAGESSVTLKDIVVYDDCYDVQLRACAMVPNVTITKVIIEKKQES